MAAPEARASRPLSQLATLPSIDSGPDARSPRTAAAITEAASPLVRAAVRIDGRSLIRHHRRSVSAVRADAGAFERDDVVAVQKGEKQRKTDGEHNRFSLWRFIRPHCRPRYRRCALVTRTARASSVPLFVSTAMSGSCERERAARGGRCCGQPPAESARARSRFPSECWRRDRPTHRSRSPRMHRGRRET
jgi:hypothetical protein